MTFYTFEDSFEISDKIYVLNGESVTMAVTPIVLTPAISTVEFVYSTDLMVDDGAGNMIVDAFGFPAYINPNPTLLTYTVDHDSLMTSG